MSLITRVVDGIDYRDCKTCGEETEIEDLDSDGNCPECETLDYFIASYL